jgi:hypothetical protein
MLNLSDRQLDVVMKAAGTLPVEKRELFLQRLSAMVDVRCGGRKPGDVDVTAISKLALEGLRQQFNGARDAQNVRASSGHAYQHPRAGAHLRMRRW